MKRRQDRKSNTPKRKTGVVAAKQLVDARGGGRIAIQVAGPSPFEMPLQHNETLVAL